MKSELMTTECITGLCRMLRAEGYTVDRDKTTVKCTDGESVVFQGIKMSVRGNMWMTRRNESYIQG